MVATGSCGHRIWVRSTPASCTFRLTRSMASSVRRGFVDTRPTAKTSMRLRLEVDLTSYSFTVTASDGNGGSADQVVTVNVNDVNENTTPVVPPTPTGGVVLDFEATESYHRYGYNEATGGSFGYGTETIKEIDGTTDRTMLVVEKGAGSHWWGGITLVAEYLGTDMIGDGTSPVTMRVYGAGANPNLDEAPGTAAYVMTEAVTAAGTMSVLMSLMPMRP